MIYILSVMISLFMLLISFFIAYKMNLDKEMIMSFECGFDPFSMVRSSFSLHFFKICLVFVFFDIEIIIVLLIPLLMNKTMEMMVYFFVMLLVILLGLLFEWSQGSIDWFY
uniref:NADH-ubiquinone oxidoreductase chain 3 n=1 Tax=Laelaps nuttalli TaxID=2902835 RepID=A0AAU6QEA7_9ACAR